MPVKTAYTKMGFPRHLDGEYQHRLGSQALNTVVQGSACEVLCAALAVLPEELKKIYGKFLLQVHDEIIVQVPEAMADQAAFFVTQAMKRGFLSVFPEAEGLGITGPGLVEAKIGKDWAEIH